jgi:hypothetical protein
MGYSETSIEILNVEIMQRNGDVEGLAKALKHRSRFVRESAAKALGEICSEMAEEHLRDSKQVLSRSKARR